MCGIAGVIYFDKNRQVELSVLKNMTNVIIHRGPDDEGYYTNDSLGFGFRRLSIIDIATGHQPLTNQEKNLCIVLNGEIYNYRELRNELQKKGYRFSTSSDTEVVIQLYNEFGEECVKYLNGMFSFAIHDIRNNRVFCARDRFGIKPFYYYLDKEKFVFGSEIKSILQCPTIDSSISMNGIESYFTYGYIGAEYSAFEKIKKLPPSNTLTVALSDRFGLKINRYWNLEFNMDSQKTENQWKEEILTCLTDSVKHHMISDVPLGAFLSGGIDSSTVVSIMSGLSNQPIKTFTIGFKEQRFNELSYAKEIAEKYHTDHHEMIVEPESIDLLPKLVKCYDEPFADSSAIPTYYVSKFAREFVTVALSGDGGDELFAGYNAYKQMLNIIMRNPLSNQLSSLIFGRLSRIWPDKWYGKANLHYLSIEKEFLGAYYTLWNNEDRNLLFLKDLKQNITSKGEDYKIGLLKSSTAPDFIGKLCHLDLQSYMVDDILTKVDRVSMHNSLEVRVPLLDHNFVELAFSIPSGLKMFNGNTKHILKYAVADLLTPQVISHPKKGFAVPLSAWFKKDLKVYLKDILTDRNQPIYNFLDQTYVVKQMNNHLTGMRDLKSKLWSLLFFNEWLSQYQK